MEPNPTLKIEYSEIVRPPLWLLAFILFLTESIALSVWAAFDNRTGLVAFVVALLIVIASAAAMTMKIEVTENELRIERAHIERRYLGEVTPLTPKEMALVRGRDADPAAFLALRFWQPRGVKIELQDKRDPAPYWLITTKKPAELTQALRRH